MIKRRFYKVDHGDRDGPDPSSSSSDSELEVEPEASEDESEDYAIAEVKPNDHEAGSTSSGYESEDGSANEVDVNSAASGLLSSEDDARAINEKQMLINKELPSKCDAVKSNLLAETESLQTDMESYVLKFKSVFKCRICPRVVILNENTLQDHLQSKRHARSKKLLKEGRLKAVLNSDGEIEEQEIAEVETKEAEDNAEKIHKEEKQHKKRFRKKKSDKANPRKISTKESAKRRRAK